MSDNKLDEDSNEMYNNRCDKIMDVLCDATDEDIDICSKLQQGLEINGYNGGIFSNEQEESVYRYRNVS